MQVSWFHRYQGYQMLPVYAQHGIVFSCVFRSAIRGLHFRTSAPRTMAGPQVRFVMGNAPVTLYNYI
jgi:hypothetical protein